jgi:glycosyltransferase involved in cell wall biosynthesis
MNPETLKNKDIIIVGQQPWDVEIGSNCKNIALELSKYNRVLYVNSPLDRISCIREKNDPKVKKRLNVVYGKENGLIQINENLWNLYPDCIVESVNWITVDFVFNFINKSNNRKFASSIKKALQKLQFSDYLLFNDNEIIKCHYLKELLKPGLSIYYSRDYILATDYWKKHGEKLEPLIIAGSDVCVANSTYLTEYCKKYNPKAFYIGQGCDLEIFKKPTQTPNDLKDIKGPVIGYVGALVNARLDMKILEHIAQSHQDWNMVLVGPEDDQFRNSSLHQYKNVFFTGSKPTEELPDYINAFDVCINPQIVNPLTIGNYPRKIDEYLIMGKPVVATKTRAMEIFKDHVSLAESKEDYVTFIENALVKDSKQLQEKRKDFASTHTWENSVKELYKAISIKSNGLMNRQKQVAESE